MADATMKTLLAVVALGLWVNLALGWLFPSVRAQDRMHQTIFQQLMEHDREMQRVCGGMPPTTSDTRRTRVSHKVIYDALLEHSRRMPSMCGPTD